MKMFQRIDYNWSKGSNGLNNQGPVVQTWVSANAGLKFNPLFWFLYFYPFVSSKTLGTKTSIDIEKISEEVFPGL